MFTCSVLNRWQAAAACSVISAAALILIIYLAYGARPQDLDGTGSSEKWLMFSDFATGETTMSFNESFSDFEGDDAVDLSESPIRVRRSRRSNLPRSKSKSKSEEEEFAASKRKRKRRLSRLERKPILNEFSFPANLVQGMRFVLMCQVLDGDLPVQIKWFKDERELLPSFNNPSEPLQQLQRLSSAQTGDQKQVGEQVGEQVELMLNDELGSSLLFRRVQQQHSGNYTCLATNQFGSASYSSTMSVKVPPKWKVEPQDQHSIMGEQITIDCQATGNPIPFIRWKFAAGSGLVPQQQPGGSSVAQPFHLDPQMAAVAAAAAAAATNFKLINSNHHVQTLENGSLAIRQVNKEHEGLFLCEADNGVEPSLVKVLRLVIQVQAHFVDDLQALDSSHRSLSSTASSPPAQTAHTVIPQQASDANSVVKSVRVAQNSSQLRLLCQPLGDFPLTVDWLKDGQLIYTHTTAMENSAIAPTMAMQQQQVVASPTFNQQPGARYHVSTRRSSARSSISGLESELLITSVRRQDAGMFTCLARNAHGQAERKLKLLVQEPPDAPEVVDVARIGSRSIGLRWLAPFDGNSPIQKYVVEFKRHTATESTLDSQQGNEFAGQSEKIMPPKPENSLIQVTSVGIEQIAGQQPQQQQQQQVQHTVHELEPLTRYSMRVFAINALGKSRPSVALSLKTEEEVPAVVPSLVEAIALSSKSIKLRWTITYPPEQEIIDGFFVGYRSLDSSQGKASGSKQLATASAQEQQTFTYKTIRLTNHQQPSASSSSSAQPSSSREIGDLEQQQRIGEQSAYLSPVSSITKSLSTGQGPSPFGSNGLQHQQSSVVVSAFEYVIGGLERDTEYTITIQCFNKKGAGPTSDPAVFRTFSSDPPEKLALIAEDISESSVNLSWRFLLSNQDQHSTSMKQPTASAQPDGFVLTFAKLAANKQSVIVKQSEHRIAQPARHLVPEQLSIHQPNRSSLSPTATSLDQWQAVQLAPQQRSHQLRGLDCGTSYALKIWAFNKVGQGEPSELLVVSTRGKAPIAPDRRSFLSINSTQVRLHLSAWYDGGCEIGKFQVQYRTFGQHEWLLVSSNIPRDQTSLVIRDLSPATSYELLISAQNQVGPAEARYRFATLDSDGRQVPFAGRSGTESFFSLGGSGPSLDADGNAETDDYMDAFDGMSTLRFGDTSYKWIPLFRRLLNSPLALGGSLLLFISLIALLFVYRYNSKLSTGSSSTLASSASMHKSSANRNPNNCDHQPASNEPLMMMGCASNRDAHNLLSSLGDCGTEAAMSLVGNGSSSLTDSPATRPPPSQYGTAQQECHYAFPNQQVDVQADVYGRVDCTLNGQHAAYGACNSFAPTTNAYGRAEQVNAQQQCLVQMLMMENQQQQRNLELADNRNVQQVEADHRGPIYASNVAALTTLGRNTHNKSARPNSFGQYSSAGSATLGRNIIGDYQQRIQQQQAVIGQLE